MDTLLPDITITDVRLRQHKNVSHHSFVKAREKYLSPNAKESREMKPPPAEVPTVSTGLVL